MKWILALCCGPALMAQTGPGQLPGLAAGALTETQLARQAIAQKDKTAAEMHLGQALANATAARDQAEMVYHSTNVPIYTSIDTTVLYAPVKHSKSGVLTAKRMKRDTNIREVSGSLTRDTLDVALAHDQLVEAQKALDSGDLATADSDLAAVQKDVIHHVTAANDIPLLRARENLILARNRVLDRKYADAKAPLRSAGDALAEYNRLNPGPHGQDALYMKSRMDAYAQNIGAHHSDASDRIQDWLDTTNKWFREMTQ